MSIDDPQHLLPPLSKAEFEALKADIKAHGVRVPIYRDETGRTLDGTHREKACRELGITDYPVEKCPGLTEDQKLELSLTLNLARRHLSRDALASIAVQLRQRGWSLKRIARALGMGKSTVDRWIKDVSHMGNVAAPAVITDTKGRRQPTRKVRRPKAATAATMEAPEAANPVEEVSRPLTCHRPAPTPRRASPSRLRERRRNRLTLRQSRLQRKLLTTSASGCASRWTCSTGDFPTSRPRTAFGRSRSGGRRN